MRNVSCDNLFLENTKVKYLEIALINVPVHFFLPLLKFGEKHTITGVVPFYRCDVQTKFNEQDFLGNSSSISDLAFELYFLVTCFKNHARIYS